jgi:hypothetical protein
VNVVTMKPADPLAQIERAQKILAKGDAGLAELEEGRLELQRVVAGSDADLEEIGARRKIEMTAATPVGELDKKLEALDRREKEASRRSEIALAILSEVETRIVAAREAEAAARRQAAYDTALKLHDEATSRVKEFLDRIVLEAREVMQAYVESEAATAAANKDRPLGCSPIMTIESERLGALPSPKTTVRKYQVFVSGRDLVAEVGKVEAHNVNGTWAVYRPSRSVQGDVVVPHCTIADFVEVTTEKFQLLPLESLATAFAFQGSPPRLLSADGSRSARCPWLSGYG